MNPAMQGLLLAALAWVMFGLGLTLTVGDFARVVRQPKAVGLAMGLQVVVLPLLCYGLVLASGLPPAMAVGMMLLAASPGGIAANLFSHLFGGNVAMNVSLTAVNTLLSVATLPLITNLAITHLAADSGIVPMQWRKVIEVVGIVVAPVVLGMWVAARRPAVAMRLARPMKLFSGLVLFALVGVSLLKEWATVVAGLSQLGAVVLAFNLASQLLSYGVSRLAGVNRPDAIAIGFEAGIHNSTLAMYIALTFLGSTLVAVPAALYAVCMLVTATGFGFWLRHHAPARRTSASRPAA